MAEVKQTRSQTKRTGGLPRTPPNEPKEEEGQGLLDPPIIPHPKLTPIDTKGKGVDIKPPKSFMSQFFDAEEKIQPERLTGFKEFVEKKKIPINLGKWTWEDEEFNSEHIEGTLKDETDTLIHQLTEPCEHQQYLINQMAEKINHMQETVET